LPGELHVARSHAPDPCDRPWPPDGLSDGPPQSHRHDDGRVCVAESGADGWQTASPVASPAAPPEPGPEDLEAVEQFEVKANEALVREIAEGAVSQREVGLYGKFHVRRADGRDAPGGDREGADYFVMDLVYDAAARVAMGLYASVVRRMGYDLLASDIERRLGAYLVEVAKAVEATKASAEAEEIKPALITVTVEVAEPSERFADTDILTAARNTQRLHQRILSSKAQLAGGQAPDIEVSVVPFA
jgi:hypothetical protein